MLLSRVIAISALRHRNSTRFLPPGQSRKTSKLFTPRKSRIPHISLNIQRNPSVSPDVSKSPVPARSRAPGDTCLFKRTTYKANKQNGEVSPQKQLNTEAHFNKNPREANQNLYQIDRSEDNAKSEGSTCTLYVGPNRIPLQIECEFVEYI